MFRTASRSLVSAVSIGLVFITTSVGFAAVGDGSVPSLEDRPIHRSSFEGCPEGMVAIDFNDLPSFQTVSRGHYAEEGALIDVGALGTAGTVSASSGPCDTSRALRTDPFVGPSIRIEFPDGTSAVSLQSGDFGGSDEDRITLLAFGPDGSEVARDAQTLPAGVPTQCLDFSVEASAIRAVELVSDGFFDNSVFVDNLCFRPALNVCDRIEAVHGSEIRRIGWDSGECRVFLEPSGNEIVDSAILESVMLRRGDPEFTPSQQDQQACAILDQTFQLCSSQVYDPLAGPSDPLRISHQLQYSSCHPNAEWECDRYQPDFAQIVGVIPDGAGVDPDPSPRDVSTHSFCTGQVVGRGPGYAMQVPLNPVQWECSGSDAVDLQQEIDELAAAGTPLFGYEWGNVTGSSNGCRYVKALLRCVVPNLGGARPCLVPRTTNGGSGNSGGGNLNSCRTNNRIHCGTAYGESEYCYEIATFTGGLPTSAHAAGRAADFNNDDRLAQFNYGNISACGPNTKCTDTSRVAQLNLPPHFVSVMEGCGFAWGGRWWRSEGLYGACDPMHFELCALDATEDCRQID